MAILERGARVGNYEIQSLIKANVYTETYRAEDADGHAFFMKFFIMKRVPEKLVSAEEGLVSEIVNGRKVKHKNIVSYIEDGVYESLEGRCLYYVTEYFNGELLSEKLQREGAMSEESAILIINDILTGLEYLHGQGLYHNDITPRNILLPRNSEMVAEIIDLGHLSERCSGRVAFDTSDLELAYCANETFTGIYDEQSDIFSTGVTFYEMLTGKQPWDMVYPEQAKRSRKAILLKDKRKNDPIDFDKLQVSDKIKAILSHMMAVDYHQRYNDVRKVLKALNDDKTEEMVEQTGAHQEPKRSSNNQNEENKQEEGDGFVVKRGGGNGFKDVAGMAELKKFLSERVIFVIKNPEMANKYRILPPNGMLFYGPPGCGKTFMAEKFAEETGFNFILVKASDLGSTFVHGSQEKIAKLFETAAKEAPTVVCFDEFDALVPDRSTPASQYVAGEVNEFLSQLNNCAKRGIFVIGTTNRPDKIDSAVLRTGRIDRQVYIPLPDEEARREMFVIHLEGRPYKDVDFDRLSKMTEGYIASDIAYVVNDAALVAAYTQQDITEDLLETSIKNIHPSLRQDVMEFYERIHGIMESQERRNIAQQRIGFQLPTKEEDN